MNQYFLDSVRNIVIDFDNPPIANMHALSYLPAGLHSLAQTVRREEIRVIEENFGRPPVLMMLGFRNDWLIQNCFSWFTVSIVNYLRLIAFTEIMHLNSWSSIDIKEKSIRDKISKHCTEYVKEVVPEIYLWRNKVAAHFAITDPFKDDNLGTLEYSVMNTLSYSCPYFETGRFSWVSNDEPSMLPKWALTKTYEDLSERLWPNAKLAKLPEYC